MSNYKKGGYDKKYIISKTSGKPTDPEADYFVLRLDKDPHAIEALHSYAISVRIDNEQLSNDLMRIVRYYKDIRKSEIYKREKVHPFKNQQR